VRFQGFALVGLDLAEGMCDRQNHQPYHQIQISLGLPFATVVLALRTYAVWGKDKRIGVGLALLLALSQIPNVIVLNRFIEGIGCEYHVASLFFPHSTTVPARSKSFLLVVQNQYPELYRGCAFTKSTRLIFADWVIIAIVEGGMPSTSDFRGL